MLSKANYIKGIKEGTWEIWDDNKTLRCQMHYKKGKKTGVWKQWDEQAKLINEKEY